MPIKLDGDIAVTLGEIAERLWSGHASVMVGAGFSKNATQNSVNSKPFLTWNQLADVIFKKIHGRSPNNNEHYLNPLKLAEEYCTIFGRPALEKLIQVTLPDLEYSPSDIHRDLLELPWNDVFTTNYDSLLERTNTSQRYDIVLCKGDLVFSQRPRIIKLHGSFPSHRPFIITEDDYRRYPREYAPFVNTVQQSLIENTLCLIGFSGDDPNFLNWIGWIRDNLGSASSPRIFLIGFLELSHSQIKVLEHKNIGVIDLSSCVTAQAEKHKAALRIFIEFLKERKNEKNRLNWPEDEHSKYSPSPNSSEEEFTAELIKTTNEWSRTREKYPGWVACPNDSRKILWSRTSNWLYGRHLKSILPFNVDISFWKELTWRLEKSLCPLDNDVACAIEKVVQRYNPYPKILNILTEFQREENSSTKIWDEISSKWLYLNFSLLRFYREEGLQEKWMRYSHGLESFFEEMSAEQRDMLRYEQCLFHLFRQEIVEFRKIIRSWKPNNSSPHYQAKKAGLLAEYGEVNEAETLLENALQLVRSQSNLTPITTDYSQLSQEAYILQLLKFVKDATSSFSNEKVESRKYIEEFNLRWMKLKEYKCDPWGELKLFEAKLNGPVEEWKTTEVLHSFDIGYTSTTHRMGIDNELFEAYAFLRYIDDIGIPYRILNTTFGKNPAIGAVKRIAKSSVNWAVTTLLRTGDVKSVDILFDRSSLIGNGVEQVENLIEVLLKILTDLSEDIERNDGWEKINMGAHYANIVPEILSRLSTICSLEKLRRIRNFLLTVYKSPRKMAYSNINHLARRLVVAWPSDDLSELISFIISEFPIVKSQHPRLRTNFPDLLDFVERELFLKSRGEVVFQEEIIKDLLNEFESSRNDTREQVFNRLVKIFELGLLSAEKKVVFGQLLWREVDNSGFPINLNNIYRWYFLELPYPSDVNINRTLHAYLQNIKFPIQGQTKSISITGGQCTSCLEIAGASRLLTTIGWSSDDSLELLKKILDWWNTDKVFLEAIDSNIVSERSKEIHGRFQKVVHTLAVAVVPFLSEQILLDEKEQIEKIIDEMSALGLSIIELKASLFLKDSFNPKKLLADIEFDILSDDLYRTSRAINVATNLLNIDKKTALDTVERAQLLSLIVNAIKWRKSNSIIAALVNFKIIAQHPSVEWDYLLPDVLMGLHHLTRESSLIYENGPIPEYDRLFVRQEAASLTYELYKYYIGKCDPIPSTLEAWRVICRDPKEFAEIRKQWPNDQVG